MTERGPLLQVEHLKQYFKVNSGYTVRAVDDVSFCIYPGETYGLVGESGSGKSTIGRSVIRLYDPTEGKILFDGMDISGRLDHRTMGILRTQMQMIFQDPMACLNPRKKVGQIIAEGLDIHHLYNSPAERKQKVDAILARVGLAPEHADRYPHQFSGGQRQARHTCSLPMTCLWSSISATGSVCSIWDICWKPVLRRRFSKIRSIPIPAVSCPQSPAPTPG